MEFEQKVVIITGASGGIGEACALKFAAAGALLTLVGRNLQNLKRVAHRCSQVGGKEPLIVIADMCVSEDVENIVLNTLKHFGKIDVLINNAGIMFVGGINVDVGKLDEMWATNVRGAYSLTQKCAPHLIESRGNVVTVSSVAATIAEPLLTPYSMTKAALDAFTRCAAAELGPRGVRVNSVNPGPIHTELFARGGLTDNVCKEKFKELTHFTPLREITQVEDVANIVVFLSGAGAKCVTGSPHYADGGLHLGVPTLRP